MTMPTWEWPDARGWIGVGSFSLTVFVLAILVWGPADLRKDDFFQAVAMLIIGGFAKDVLGWAYQATKGGGELAEKNAAIVQENATASVTAATALAANAAANQPSKNGAAKVEVVNTAENPAKVTDTGPPAKGEDAGLPESLR